MLRNSLAISGPFESHQIATPLDVSLHNLRKFVAQFHVSQSFAPGASGNFHNRDYGFLNASGNGAAWDPLPRWTLTQPAIIDKLT